MCGWDVGAVRWYCCRSVVVQRWGEEFCFHRSRASFQRVIGGCGLKSKFPRDKNATEFYRGLLEACGGDALPYRTVAR